MYPVYPVTPVLPVGPLYATCVIFMVAEEVEGIVPVIPGVLNNCKLPILLLWLYNHKDNISPVLKYLIKAFTPTISIFGLPLPPNKLYWKLVKSIITSPDPVFNLQYISNGYTTLLLGLINTWSKPWIKYVPSYKNVIFPKLSKFIPFFVK